MSGRSPGARTGRLGRRAAGPLLLLLAAGGCGGGTGSAERVPDAGPAEPPPRRFAEVAWREVFRVGGTPDDTLLLQPGRIAADAAGVTVVDLHGGRAMRFGREGEHLWSWGRKGPGPDELAHPRDLQLDDRGRAWILDVESARVVVLGPDGRPVARIRLDGVGGRPDDLVPLEAGGALLLLVAGEGRLVRIDERGRVLAREPLPWPGSGDLGPLEGQLIAGSDPASGAWAAAFQVGDGFLGFRGARPLGYRGRFVEPVPVGRSVERRAGGRFGRSETVTSLSRPTFSAWSVTVAEGTIHVLYAGHTERARRMVDLYELESGAYRETLLLPRRVNQIARGGALLYATYADPYPTLVAWRSLRSNGAAGREPEPGGDDAADPDAPDPDLRPR